MERLTARIGVYKAGYEWQKCPKQARLRYHSDADQDCDYLVPVGMEKLPIKDSDVHLNQDDYRWYDPFASETALFRELAALPAAPDAIVNFANQYGNITSEPERGESWLNSLEWWTTAITKMRRGVTLLDDYLAARPAGRKYADLSEQLRKMLDPIVEAPGIRTRLVERKGTLAIESYAGNLYSVVRLQLLYAVIERKTYRNCVHCDRPFEINPRVGRSDRTHCGQMCRVKAYQRRRKQAEMMRADGVSLRDIARELETNMQTVKGWVKDVIPKEKK